MNGRIEMGLYSHMAGTQGDSLFDKNVVRFGSRPPDRKMFMVVWRGHMRRRLFNYSRSVQWQCI